jgi:GNAT superfamily N-acetyltransferase
MAGPVIAPPRPLVPQDPSVFDSALTKAMRLIGDLMGDDDPAGQILGMASAMDVPGGVRGALGKAVEGLRKRIAPQITVSLDPRTGFLSARSDSGLVGGHVRDGALHISYAEVDEAQRGQGIGTALYERLIEKAHADGLRVVSDKVVEPAAVRVYDSLARRGYGVKRLPGGTLDDGVAFGAADGPAFEVAPKREIQAAQGAQQ